jgi:hypothetical protein
VASLTPSINARIARQAASPRPSVTALTSGPGSSVELGTGISRSIVLPRRCVGLVCLPGFLGFLGLLGFLGFLGFA